MGYSTDFSGCLSITPAIKPEHKEYINQFSEVRHMKRNAEALEAMPDPIREAVGLPVGAEGEYFVGGGGFAGQERDGSIVDYNCPSSTQPGLWCQWVVDEEGDLVWDEAEKFYNYVDWLEYLIKHFFAPWGYQLNGEIKWQGESMDDRGLITVANNQVLVANLQ